VTNPTPTGAIIDMQRHHSWAAALSLFVLPACLPAADLGGEVRLTDAESMEDPASESANGDASAMDTDDESSGATIPYCPNILRDPLTTDLAYLTVVSAGNASIASSILIDESSDKPCYATDAVFADSASQGALARTGEFRLSLRTFDGSWEDLISILPIAAALVGEPLYTTETYTLATDEVYILVLSNDLSSEVLITDGSVALPGTYSIRVINEGDEPVSIFAWDRLDLDAEPRVIATDFGPGAFTDRLKFDLVPDPNDETRVVSSVIISTNGEDHPLRDEYSRDPSYCPPGSGIFDTLFVTSDGGVGGEIRCI